MHEVVAGRGARRELRGGAATAGARVERAPLASSPRRKSVGGGAPSMAGRAGDGVVRAGWASSVTATPGNGCQGPTASFAPGQNGLRLDLIEGDPGKVAVRPNRLIQPGHLWIGNEDKN